MNTENYSSVLFIHWYKYNIVVFVHSCYCFFPPKATDVYANVVDSTLYHEIIFHCTVYFLTYTTNRESIVIIKNAQKMVSKMSVCIVFVHNITGLYLETM